MGPERDHDANAPEPDGLGGDPRTWSRTRGIGRETAPAPVLQTGAAVAGFFPETSLLSLPGRWTRADVYIEAPVTWTRNGGARIFLRSMSHGIVALVASARLTAITLEPVGSSRVRGIILSAGPHPSERWDVSIAFPENAGDGLAAGAAHVALEVWGTEA